MARRSINLIGSLLLVGCAASPAATLVPTLPPTVAATPLVVSHSDWPTYTSSTFPITLQYPPKFREHAKDEFRSDDGYTGFFVLRYGYIEGVSVNGVCAGEAYQLDPWYGRNPELSSLTVSGYPACLIISSEDQEPGMKKQSAVVVKLPRPIMINNAPANFIMLVADRVYIRDMAATMKITLR